ncbi:MAG TPA: hypothetical protein VFR41_10425 [Acidimicrobiia bacterium]|nr:hypothetical protein [Acidimicrobiia bacterium]
MSTRRRRLFIAGCVAVLTLPLLIALVVLHQPRWYPLLDMAQTELKLRDVWSRHPPLIGLAGRIGPYSADGGSHPGPISFYALWPVWAILHRAAFGMFASTVALDVVAFALSLWMAFRRGGVALTLGLTAMLAVLTHSYGAYLLTLAWNPYMPVLWWIVFVLAVWSVLVDDLPMLPIAIVAGMFCMQTHVSYDGLVGGVLTGLAVWLSVRAWRTADAALRRRALRWGLGSLALLVLLWVPPVVDQIIHHPGNLSILRDYFGNPPERSIGPHAGLNDVLTQISPVTLVSKIVVHEGSIRPVGGSTVPGALLVVAFAASVWATWRARLRSLLRLDLVIGVALVLGWISAARIFGYVWYYLLLWGWGLSALMLFAIGWTIASVVREPPSWVTRAAAAGVVAIIVGFVSALAVDASTVDVQTPRVNEKMAQLVPATIRALRDRQRAGAHGPYLVTFFPDPESIGAQGFGFLNELDRAGLDARTEEKFRPSATRTRVVHDDNQATLQIHVAVGADIDRWRADPRFTEIAVADARPAADRAEFDALRSEVLADLDRIHYPNAQQMVDQMLFNLGIATDVPAATKAKISRMLNIGMPTAVFFGPIGDPQPR